MSRLDLSPRRFQVLQTPSVNKIVNAVRTLSILDESVCMKT